MTTALSLPIAGPYMQGPKEEAQGPGTLGFFFRVLFLEEQDVPCRDAVESR